MIRLFHSITKISIGILFLVSSCNREEEPEPQPTIADLIISIDENPDDNDIIGVFSTQNISSTAKFDMVSQTPSLAVDIDEDTGELFVLNAFIFDYEQNTQITGQIELEDGEDVLTANFIIEINDVEELRIDDFITTIAELPLNGTALGSVNTFSISDDINYSLYSETPSGAINLDARTGEITVADRNFFYFETYPVITGEIIARSGTATDTANYTISIQNVEESQDFITKWKVDGFKRIKLPLYASTEATLTEYDFIVDWGDGTVAKVTAYNDSDAEHRYSENGEYTVKISGLIKGFSFWENDFETNLIDVQQWGNVQLGNDGGIFRGCINLKNFSATDAPDLSEIDNMNAWFSFSSFNDDISDWDVSGIKIMANVFGHSPFNQDISNWDISNVISLSGMFSYSAFNQDISGWDVSNVKDMTGLFYFSVFNQDISGWDVSNVTNMGAMFSEAHFFSYDITGWDVSNVQDMSSMFRKNNTFNQDISGWDVGNVKDMFAMFENADAFDQDIGNWNVDNVENMESMFEDADLFNQDISNWNVGNVRNMSSMFKEAVTFNQPLGVWDVSNVEDMSGMFFEALNFNQNINDWEVGNVVSFGSMFSSAESFNQPLNQWDVSKSTSFSGMFQGATNFNQDIGDWNVNSAIHFLRMFENAASFNQDIGEWNVENVTSMLSTFKGATSFNQDISGWDVSKVFDMISMFEGATSFNQDLSNWNTVEVLGCRNFSTGSALSLEDLPTLGCFQ